MIPKLVKDVWGEDADGNRGIEFTYWECSECGGQLVGGEEICQCCGAEVEMEEDDYE